MEQIYSYRGFDVVVSAMKEDDTSGHPEVLATQGVYVAGVTLKTSLIAGEWSTNFRIEPVPGCLSADLREVLAAGFAAAINVIDDVIGVMGGVFAGKQSSRAKQVV